MKILLKTAALLLLASATQGQSATEAGAQPAQAPLVLPEERRWRLGAALGFGERTNPLIQSEDIPVIIDLDIAYFGDRWFFDNGDLGVGLVDNQWLTTNLVARLNSDRTFFGKTNTRYVNFQMLAGGATAPIPSSGPPGPPSPGEPVAPLQPLKPPKRDYAVEAGFETLLGGDWGQATLRAFHDVGGTHGGFEISADYSYRFTRGRLSVAPVVGVSWKSADLSDYYWGVHDDEDSATLQAYEARGGLGWEAGMRASWYFNKRMRFALSANFERLQHSIAQSPLVERDYVFGYFAGLGWQF
jgi:outer membrane protein